MRNDIITENINGLQFENGKKTFKSFAELLQSGCCVTAQDKYNGRLEVYSNEYGWYGDLTKKYVQKICRSLGHSFRMIYKG